MKVTDIPFEDEAFKQCVLETGAENAEQILELKCRKRHIKSVAGIEYLTELRFLDLTRNQLTRLDLSKNTKLTDLFVGSNELSELDISGCSELACLEIFSNALERIDLSHNPRLEEICAMENELASISFAANPELLIARLNGNFIAALELPPACKLESLELKNNPLPGELLTQLQQLPELRLQV